MRTPRPLEPWEIDREKDEYTPPSLTDQEKEDIKIKYGRSFYSAHYDYIQDPSVYLSENDQNAYFDEIARLARNHFLDSRDEEIKMLQAHQYALDHAERFEEIVIAMHFRRYKLITLEEKALYILVKKYRSLPPEEIRRIGEKESAIGVDLLPEKHRNLFKRWAKNKYRRNWFELTMKIIDIAQDGFFDEVTKDGLLKRARALKDKVNFQSKNKIKNKAEDVKEGDSLIQEALEQLFPSIKGLEGEARKKELQKLLGIVAEENSTAQSPRT